VTVLVSIDQSFIEGQTKPENICLGETGKSRCGRSNGVNDTILVRNALYDCSFPHGGVALM
jgi:hypothetical protein